MGTLPTLVGSCTLAKSSGPRKVTLGPKATRPIGQLADLSQYI
jgi:hypothetical protein